MDQISEHINSSNQKIHSYVQIRKMVVNLVSKKLENNETFLCQLTRLQEALLMSITNTPENGLSNVDRESEMRKLR